MKNKKIKMIPCPVCGYYTIVDDFPIMDICPVCFWQYDIIAQEQSDRIIGPNHGITYNQAKKNYKKYGAISIEHIEHTRPPFENELPENNN